VQREVSCGASALLAATAAPSGIAASAARVAEPERDQYDGLTRSRNGRTEQSASAATRPSTGATRTSRRGIPSTKDTARIGISTAP
jgi:hypothetical protein